MLEIEKKVEEAVLGSGLISRGELVLCAVSGGVDSMVLMELLYRLQERAGFDMHVTCFDHGLRGTEGARDSDFVASQASSRELGFTAGQGDVRGYMKRMGVGLEEAARILRYDFLFDLKERIGADKIATAHHADDQTETILMRLLRGTGFKGLRGIRAEDSRGLIRPLLEITKNEILEFSNRNRVEFREDPTNALSITLRNRLRNDILPMIPAEYRERLAGNILSLSESVGEVVDFLETVVQKVYSESVISQSNNEIKLDLKKLKGYHYFLRKEVCRRSYFMLHDSGNELSRRSSFVLAGFCERGQSGKTLQLPGGVRVLKDFDTVTITRKSEINNLLPSMSVLVEPENETLYAFGNLQCRFEVSEVGQADRSDVLLKVRKEGGRNLNCFDYEKLVLPLSMRVWQDGDRLEPFGLDGRKKLSDILAEERVPRSIRADVPILEDGKRILWVLGSRRSSHAVVTSSTRLILTVEVSKKENSNEKQDIRSC